MSKYDPAQLEVAAICIAEQPIKIDHKAFAVTLDGKVIGEMLRAYAADLREREAAKGVVTDEVERIAREAYNRTLNRTSMHYMALRAALEAVLPMVGNPAMPKEWCRDVETLLDAVEFIHGADSTDADCPYCAAANRLSAMLNAVPTPPASEDGRYD